MKYHDRNIEYGEFPIRPVIWTLDLILLAVSIAMIIEGPSIRRLLGVLLLIICIGTIIFLINTKNQKSKWLRLIFYNMLGLFLIHIAVTNSPTYTNEIAIFNKKYENIQTKMIQEVNQYFMVSYKNGIEISRRPASEDDIQQHVRGEKFSERMLSLSPFGALVFWGPLFAGCYCIVKGLFCLKRNN